MISDRNQRRIAKRQMKQQAARVRSGKIERLPARPDVDELFRLDDDGTGRALYFDVRALRSWARENLQPANLMIEQWRAERFVASGAVDVDHLTSHTVRHSPDPVIVCRDAAGPGEDAIVDGAHRYVLAAMAIAHISTTPMPYPAYALTPDQWRPFVLSGDREREAAARFA